MSVGASMVGTEHARRGTPCQDAVAWRQSVAERFCAVALADGAGSSSHSEVGARQAASTTVEWLREKWQGDTVGVEAGEALLREILKRLETVGMAMGIPVTALACTLLFVAVREDRYVAGHIGDGVIASIRGGRSQVLSAPDRGEYLNETIFVTSCEALTRMRVFSGNAGDMDGFCLMSDGAAEALFQRATGSLAPAVATLASWLDRAPLSMVEDAIRTNLTSLFRQKTGDDCSIGILRRVELDLETVLGREERFQRGFLDIGSSRRLRSVLKIIRCRVEAGNEAAASQLATRTGLSKSTVIRHLRTLRQLEAKSVE